MTAHTPCPMILRQPEGPMLFCSNQDKNQTAAKDDARVAKQACPTKQPVGFAAKVAAEATPEDEQSEKKKEAAVERVILQLQPI